MGTASNQRKGSPDCDALDTTTAFWQNSEHQNQTEANSAEDSDTVKPIDKVCAEAILATIKSLHSELAEEIDDVFEVFDLFSLVQKVVQESTA